MQGCTGNNPSMSAVIDPIVIPSLLGLFVLSVILEAIKDDKQRHHHHRY